MGKAWNVTDFFNAFDKRFDKLESQLTGDELKTLKELRRMYDYLTKRFFEEMDDNEKLYELCNEADDLLCKILDWHATEKDIIDWRFRFIKFYMGEEVEE